ncbi:hypothetical protein N7499_001907 [Penicillium canescens]|uniref:Uncharacterized protein n=1 Tax=Penicillium canescens TaxID=5083 RepID=A0AAD6N645_PENCN|nr:uncharacterized protein N7446_009442 [Penicillium canescens]KAJ6002227.1 hypothetical protein N7522_007454 [Penicillium canescens]KAJ6034688.1 hypothetical protein N7460_008863 [Penicillium canescens]KAJ6046350.1 hypothetical protein N7444_007604 [Penicillium canescens]KAJ6053430.1 hypothetical protein N7446_009442 [Penicillium canescens]KAJ6097533.1 hypothetical protein N7499_001907 [Penicillium canescens]
MTEFRMPLHQGPPARKPLAGPQPGYGYQPYDAPRGQLAPHLAGPQTTHSRTRTTSSSVLPYTQGSHHYHGAPPPPPIPQNMTVPHHSPSRRMSSTTTSTSSTGNHPTAHGAPSVSDIRRTASSRSANSQLGYVALMRRQKATVWCDRAQPEDARLREQAMRDKKRAYLEVHGSGAGRAGTLASGKIRHGPKGAADFSPSNLVGAKVPVRLSANEIGDGEDDALSSDGGAIHRRTGSGRSSLGSQTRYPSGYSRPQGTMGSNSTPPNEKTDLPEVSENRPAEIQAEEKSRLSSLVKDDAATTHSSEQEQEDFVGDMEAPSAANAAAQKAKKADELRRRGSVDERTTSMTNVRLFVANPDLSD